VIRNDDSQELELLNIESYTTRSDIRRFLLQTWSNEVIYTKYRYFVDVLSNGDKVYLERPGRLNKGCDFVIFVENKFLYKNGNDRPPAHNDILNDLRNKKEYYNIGEWTNLLSAINIIFHCGNYDSVLFYIANLPSNIGMDIETLLKLIRWFFIEQDLTYWSGMGREMLFEEINHV
jgi:hypothetical protein